MAYIKTKIESSRHQFSILFAICNFNLKLEKAPSLIPNFIMQSAIVFLAVVATAAAGAIVAPVGYAAGSYLTRAPRFDSAVIKSDRLGGNFAYSVQTAEAYAHHTPIVQHVTSPVGVSYTHGAPVVTGYSSPAVYSGYGAHPIAYNAGYGAYGYPAYAGYNNILG